MIQLPLHDLHKYLNETISELGQHGKIAKGNQ